MSPVGCKSMAFYGFFVFAFVVSHTYGWYNTYDPQQSMLRGIPLIQMPLKFTNGVNDEADLTRFPVSTYITFVESHLNRSSAYRTRSIDTKFLKRLLQCVNTDPLCSYSLGNLYFQGLVIPGVVFPEDTGKNITRAIALWRYAASKGCPDAQYQMGLVYSTMYNPPSFLMEPQEMWENIRDKMNQTFRSTVQSLGTPNNQVESIVRHIPPLEIHRFFSTMRVLDFNPKTDHVPGYEELLSTRFLKAFRKQRQPSFPIQQSKDTCVPKQEIFSAKSQTEQGTDFSSKIRLPKRFPLHRREGLAAMYFYMAAQANHVGAKIALGYRHLKGIGVPERCHTAASYYLHVAREVVDVSSEGIPQTVTNIRISLLGLETFYDLEKVQLSAATGDLKSHFLDLQFHVAQSGDPRTQTSVGKLHLFGLEDLPQDFNKAFHYFSLAAQNDYKEAIAYLGYLYALGLGTRKDLDTAFKLFSYATTSSHNSLAHNGLGYIYFKGTGRIPSNYSKAFYHFNISASNGFPDAQYNLGAMYFSGIGVKQSFLKGFSLLTRAVEQGHSGAVYMMGIVYLNGLGTTKDCHLAAKLFRRVAMRHHWVVERVQKVLIYLRKKRKEEAGFLYWSLAEAGHEASQNDLATLLDGGGMFTLVGDRTGLSKPLTIIHSIMRYVPILKRRFFQPTSLFSLDRQPSIGVNRVFAQKYWELAVGHRSAQAYCRLGDYAYYGWGLTPMYRNTMNLDDFRLLAGVDTSDDLVYESLFVDNEGQSMAGWAEPRELFPSAYVRRLHPDLHSAFRFYEAAVVSAASGNYWGHSYVAQAEFFLARLHQLGAGTPQDLNMAAKRLKRITQLDSPTSTTLAKISLFILRCHSAWLYLSKKSLYGIVKEDKRLLFVLINCILLCVILLTRMVLSQHVNPTSTRC